MQFDGIERITARLHADMLGHSRVAIRLERHAEGERLRDRLNRERTITVAGLVDGPARRGQADSEVLRIGFSQFGNVRGHLPVCVVPKPVVHRFDRGLQFVFFRRATRHTGRALAFRGYCNRSAC